MVDKRFWICVGVRVHECRWSVKYLAYLFMPILIAIWNLNYIYIWNIKLTVLKFVPKGSGLDIL